MASSSSTPMKPPRKSGKETGILMAVIKTLSSTASTDQRDREKSKLEKEYRKSDQQLESLIAEKQESLHYVMETFSTVCTNITKAKKKVADVKSNLQKCKMLLHCRREELERLWLEGVEHKHALQTFDRIQSIRSGCDQFNKALSRKQYKNAVDILMTCHETWNNDLELVEGLKDVRNDIHMKKDKIYEILKEELYKEIYMTSMANAFELRQSSSFKRSSSDRRSSGRNRSSQNKKVRRLLESVSGSGNTLTLKGPAGLGNEPSLWETQELDAFMLSVVECMKSLKEMTRFCEDLKTQLEEKLSTLVEDASQQIIEFGDSSGINESDASLFTELLEVLFNQFRWIVRAYVKLLGYVETTTDKPISRKFFFDEEYVWSAVQTVLQSTLKIYFDVTDNKADNHATEAISTRSDFELPTAESDINSYFARRRPQRVKKLPLFKFEYSMHGLNINDYVNEKNDTQKQRFLVCKPNPRNIIVIYGAVQKFVNEIEAKFDGKKCELGKFMGNNVNRVFVQQVYKDISEAIEQARKNPDSFREVISVEETKAIKHPLPIFQSVVLIGQSVKEVTNLSQDLPSHREQLLRILEALLTTYKNDICTKAYLDIVQPDANEKGKISATWVRDEDIERLLKSLPNWSKLQKGKMKKQDSMDESPEDLSSQSLRESELLSGIFNGKVVLANEIISDVKNLSRLAQLQESMEWFAECVSSVAASFDFKTDPSLAQPANKVHSIASQFYALADTCLLVLHLEVRVHCFYYLLPITQQCEFAPGIDQQNPDPEVVKLSRDINSIHHSLNTGLQRVKSKYVFEGVGHLIATILIAAAEQIQRINDNGVKKMCRNIYALQQTLSTITKQPEQALDKARQYYELFFHTPEELVDTILEKGSQFKELEYMNALKLLYRSKPGLNKDGLSEQLNRLSNVLGDIGVVV